MCAALSVLPLQNYIFTTGQNGNTEPSFSVCDNHKKLKILTERARQVD